MNNELITEDSLLAMRWKEQVLYLAEHGAEERFIRALIRTKPESEWSVLENAQTPSVVRRAIDTLYWEDDAFAHQREIKEQPKYRPVNEVLTDFLGKGKKQAARKELQVRLPYLTAYEQKQIIYAFLDTDVKTDRVFVLKYLDAHFDPMYMKAVEVVWGLHHDFEAAKLLTHYASDEFIAENFEHLVQDYRYLPVRLRMPADYPVERRFQYWHEYLYLCARQHLPITEKVAFSILSNTIHLRLLQENMAFEGASLFRLSFMFPILWSLGELGFSDIILRFYLENERTKHLFEIGDWDEIRDSITAQLEEDGFFTCYDVLDPDRKPEDILPPSSIEEHPEDFEE
ncbi:MAG: hypothetical protein IKO26_04695 [Paludibacteraceae bacterium]|nr:hypothetical protein [Paludibacteraceae bacterium]